MLWLLFAFSILNAAVANYGQRVAPGVPPQQYQQPAYQQPPQHVQHQQAQPQFQQQQHQQQAYQQQQYQQQQQVPVQQQQVPIQQQQVHPQQQQVPVQQQQAPVQPQHHAHHQGQNVQILNPTNMEHEKEHIAEHMEVPIDTSKMSEQELQFHYFKMHDADNNNKLDGCELIKSLIHWHEQGHKHGDQAAQPTVQEKIFADDELTNLIDPILNMDDHNRDGYIDYPEFVRAQQKNQKNQPKN